MYIIKFIRIWLKNRKLSKLINDTIEQEKLVQKISTILETQFSKTKNGRIYAVLNPYIKNGKYSPEQVLEIKESGGYDNTQWIKHWTLARLTLINNFINTENLFELLTYNIEDLGESNYLFIIEPVTYKQMLKAASKAIYEATALILLSLIISLAILF